MMIVFFWINVKKYDEIRANTEENIVKICYKMLIYGLRKCCCHAVFFFCKYQYPFTFIRFLMKI